MKPRRTTLAERQAAFPNIQQQADSRPAGLGDRLKSLIHRGVDAMPLSDETKKAVKGCAGCGRRATAINKAEAKVKQFFGIGSDASPAKPTD